jgi:predicted RNA binding protein YcfA (HicA-like mRNA interferase family)
MKIPRDLSGNDLVKMLCRQWGYRVIHQEGSHIILQTEEPSHHRVAVPAHNALRIGTLNAILRAVGACKGVTRDALLDSLH